MPMSLAASGLLTSLRGIWIVLTRLFYSITHATFIIVSFLKKFNKKLLQQCIKNKLCYNFAYKKRPYYNNGPIYIFHKLLY